LTTRRAFCSAKNDSSSASRPSRFRYELLHDLLAAGVFEVERGRVPVRLRVLAEVLEARVAEPRPRGGGVVHLPEVLQHRPDRRVQAVQVDPVEPALGPPLPDRAVVLPQPADEVEHVGVAPHPLREPLEPAERVARVRVVVEPLHEPVHAPRVRPVRLDGHRRETLLADQSLRQLRPDPVELVRAVGGLAHQHVPRFAHEVHQRVERLRGGVVETHHPP
jgi:hypothetical protein